MTDIEYLMDLAFKNEHFQWDHVPCIDDFVERANAILAQKIKNHSAPVKLWKGPNFTHEGRVVLIKEVQK